MLKSTEMQEIEELNRIFNDKDGIMDQLKTKDWTNLKNRKEIVEILNKLRSILINIGGFEEIFRDKADSNANARPMNEWIEELSINSSAKTLTITIARLTYLVNKITKWYCNKEVNRIIYGENESNESNQSSFDDLKRKLKEIFDNFNINTSADRDIKESDVLENFLDSNEGISICSNCQIHKINVKDMYKSLSVIWKTEAILYEIKTILNKALIIRLINDNYKEFHNWGFSYDTRHNMWVFNFDNEGEIRYSFHVPMLEKVTNDTEVTEILKYFVYGNSNMGLRKNNLVQYTQGSSFFKDKRDKISRDIANEYFTRTLIESTQYCSANELFSLINENNQGAQIGKICVLLRICDRFFYENLDEEEKKRIFVLSKEYIECFFKRQNEENVQLIESSEYLNLDEEDLSNQLSDNMAEEDAINRIREKERIIEILKYFYKIEKNDGEIKISAISKEIDEFLTTTIPSEILDIVKKDIEKDAKKLNNIIPQNQSMAENELRKNIEKFLSNPSTMAIITQKGSNVDKMTSIYALQLHMRKNGCENIPVIEVNAGETDSVIEKRIQEYNAKNGTQLKGGVLIDGGKLKGNQQHLNENIIEINANTNLGEKSACACLARCGIYVPQKLIEYADTRSYSERDWNPNDGFTLGRNIQITDENSLKKLYMLSETIRLPNGEYVIYKNEVNEKGEKIYHKLKLTSGKSFDDDDVIDFESDGKIVSKEELEKGIYLMDTTMNEDEICFFDLKEKRDKLKKDLRESAKKILKNIYEINVGNETKRICIVNEMVNFGALRSYSLGCDYYCSFKEDEIDCPSDLPDKVEINENGKISVATFSITSDKLDFPKKVRKLAESLKDRKKNDSFLLLKLNESESDIHYDKNKKMLVCGGGKNKDLRIVQIKDERKSSKISEVNETQFFEKFKRKVFGDKGESLKRLYDSEEIDKILDKLGLTDSMKDIIIDILGSDISFDDIEAAGEAMIRDMSPAKEKEEREK